MKQTNEKQTKISNKPIKNFKCGTVSLAIWENENEAAGEAKVFNSCTISKQYYDEKTKTWKPSTSFNLMDLPKLTLLTQKAYEYIIFRDVPVNNAVDSD